MPVNLLGLDQSDLSVFFESLGESAYRGVQACRFIHKTGGHDISQLTTFSKKLRADLAAKAFIKAPDIVQETLCRDGTIKWLMSVDCGNRIETVYIPEAKRATLCVSSQVGCMLNCTFCATGAQGFNRNLKSAEIIGQLWRARDQLNHLQQTRPITLPAITNIVFMGMGEPLLNLTPVLKAVDLMQSDQAYALARRRITISTSGVVPQIYEMLEKTRVSLAISLHAPTNALRNQLVPLNKKYPIETLLKAARAYLGDCARERVTIEYVMLKGVNDSLEQANQLVRLLEGLPCKINLIPFNAYAGDRYQRSDPACLFAFRNRLITAGFIATIRRERGNEMGGACGQLVGDFSDKTKRRARLIQTQLVQQEG